MCFGEWERERASLELLVEHECCGTPGSIKHLLNEDSRIKRVQGCTLRETSD